MDYLNTAKTSYQVATGVLNLSTALGSQISIPSPGVVAFGIAAASMSTYPLLALAPYAIVPMRIGYSYYKSRTRRLLLHPTTGERT